MFADSLGDKRATSFVRRNEESEDFNTGCKALLGSDALTSALDLSN